MEFRNIGEDYVVRLDRGEEVMECLTNLCEKEGIALASISGIGASDCMEVGLYNVSEKKYYPKEFTGEMEVTSLVGSVTEKDGKPYLHIHANACDEELRVIGGHLKKCRISGTGEIFLHTLPGKVGRQEDLKGQTGLNVFSFE